MSDQTTNPLPQPDPSLIEGRTAVVTGGANGLGKAFVQALHYAGLKVCFGDMNAELGAKVEEEFPGTTFVQCDVTSWADQLALFQTAATLSPSRHVHHVIVNAGIAVNDDVFAFDGTTTGPREPQLKTIDVNLRGALYTTKLALHHFVAQNGTEASPDQEDTSLTFIGSGAAFLDCPRGPQYSASKWALRGVMHALRRTAFYHGTRVNLISPWYLPTSILPASAFDHVQKAGVEFARLDDGGKLLLKILGDKGINGKMLFLSPRKWAGEKGFLDLELDNYFDEDTHEILREIQRDQLKGAPVEEGLFMYNRW